MRPAVTTGVSKVRVHISVSADEYVASPNESLENPLGEGGEALHEWVVALRAWREPHGMEGGEVNASTPVVEGMTANVGARSWAAESSAAAQAPGTVLGEGGGATTRRSTCPCSSSRITNVSRSPSRTRRSHS